MIGAPYREASVLRVARQLEQMGVACSPIVVPEPVAAPEQMA